MKVNKGNLLDLVILYWIIIHVFIISWLGYLVQSQCVLIFLICLRFISDIRRIIRLQTLYIGLFTSIVYPLISYSCQGGYQEILLDNVVNILSTTLLFSYLSYISVNKRDFAYDFLLKNKYLFNGYMILNIPVILLQLCGVTSLSGRHPQSMENLYREDMISGMFGYNGTGLLTMYFCFLMLYNLILVQKKHIKRKNLFAAYNVILFLFMIFVATKSDNKSMILLLPIFIVTYIILFQLSISKSFIRKVKKIFKYSFLSIVFLGLFGGALHYWFGIGEIIYDVFDKIKYGWENTNHAHGSAERLGMISYALSEPKIRWYGMGIANLRWKEERGLGFAHFGISDLGSFICLGGLFFVLIILLLWFAVYRKAFRDKVACYIFMLLTVVVLTYTQLMTILSLSVSWFFIVLSIEMGIEDVNKKGI